MRGPSGHEVKYDPSEHEDIVTSLCPKCSAEQEDFDGFGVVLKCDTCGFCAHPTYTSGLCDICGVPRFFGVTDQ